MIHATAPLNKRRVKSSGARIGIHDLLVRLLSDAGQSFFGAAKFLLVMHNLMSR